MFFIAPLSADAKMKQKEIRAEYRALLDRDPVTAELTHRATMKGKVEDLRKRLVALPERDRLLTTIYQQLLGRRPRPHERAAWKKDTTPVRVIRESILTSNERQSALEDLYLNMVGRYPSDDERRVSQDRGIPLADLRQSLMTSDERKTAIIDRFASVLWRAPEDAEMQFFVSTGQSLDVIGQNTPPVARAGDDQVVYNDVELIILDGSPSADLEGVPLTYRWTVVETPPETQVTLSDPTSIRTAFRIPRSDDDPLSAHDGVYRFQLIVSDGQTKSTPDEVEVRVRTETQFEDQLLALVNTLRNTEGDDGIAPLTFQASLLSVARQYSRNLFVNGGLTSIDRNGKGPSDRVQGEGYEAKRVAENIAVIKSKSPIRLTEKRVQDIMNGWNTSVDHKKNMMRKEFVETGIGFFGGRFARGEYRLYAVQVFAEPKPPPPPEPLTNDTTAPPSQNTTQNPTTPATKNPAP